MAFPLLAIAFPMLAAFLALVVVFPIVERPRRRDHITALSVTLVTASLVTVLLVTLVTASLVPVLLVTLVTAPRVILGAAPWIILVTASWVTLAPWRGGNARTVARKDTKLNSCDPSHPK